MASLINELVAVLNEQAENYENLLALSFEKKDVIIQNDIDTLQKITAIENKLIGANQRLEKTRIAVVSDIAHVLGRDKKELTLSELCEMIRGQNEYEELSCVAERIRAAVAGLGTANEQNRVLIHNALEYIDFTMNVIRDSVVQEPPVYTPKGEKEGDSSAFFDVKQ